MKYHGNVDLNMFRPQIEPQNMRNNYLCFRNYDKLGVSQNHWFQS